MLSSNRQRGHTINLILLAVLSLGAILAMTPMLYMVATAFKANAYTPEFPPRFLPETPTLSNFTTALSSRNFGQAFLNSAGVAITTTGLVTLLSAMMAYAFARFQFRGKQALFYIMLGMMMVPAMTFIIPQFIVARTLDLPNKVWGLVVVYTAGPLAFNTFLLRGFFEALPRELEESALIDGANHFTIFTRIIVPLSRPALSTVAVFSFLGAWDEYIWALTVMTDPAKRTLPVAIANFRGAHLTDWGLIFASSLVAVVPTILLFIFFQRFFVQGLTAGALKG
ncbi:MAG: carbohydrate ABC transporter permease [Anaerolineae bacterium]